MDGGWGLLDENILHELMITSPPMAIL